MMAALENNINRPRDILTLQDQGTLNPQLLREGCTVDSFQVSLTPGIALSLRKLAHQSHIPPWGQTSFNNWPIGVQSAYPSAQSGTSLKSHPHSKAPGHQSQETSYCDSNPAQFLCPSSAWLFP